jgi:hypothetical protein
MVAVGYEIREHTMTWYLGEPTIGWAESRAAHLRVLQARSVPVDPSVPGAVVRTITVPIVALADDPRRRRRLRPTRVPGCLARRQNT